MFSLKSKKAFTLLEILVVLFIIVFIFTISSQKLFSKKVKIRKSFQDLIHLNRRLYVSSKLHNNNYRLVLNLNREEEDEFWVERKEKNNNKEFILDENFFEEPQKITPLLDITEIEATLWKESKNSGLVYVYYYPKGLSQEMAFQFKRLDQAGQWTLYLDPVKKEFQLFNKEKSLKDIKKI